MLSRYTGMNPGDVPGNLPNPYYWWEAGAMFNALINYWSYTGDDRWNDIIMQAITWQAGSDGTFMPTNQTRTEGNDDQAFWAFAAMSAAERNFPNPPDGQPGWLAMAQAAFNTQAPRWNTESCGGGLRWQIYSFNNGYHYKNTISNGCFFNLAARLARYTGNQTYADWAVRAWDWTVSVGFMTEDYLFLDGADERKNCTDFNRLQWTYNSGVYLLGAASMYNLTNGDPIWKERTQRILDATKVYFKNDVLYERACETINTCEVDQRTFKGYLARWMAASAQVAPFILDQVMPKLRTSASAAARTCTGGPDNSTCGMKWTLWEWDNSDDVGVQMSSLEVIQATLVGSVDPPVTQDTGGTSEGNPNGGTKSSDPQPLRLRRSINTADRAGAGVVFNEGPNFEVKVEMVPVPEPGPDDVLIRLNITGICSSDLHMMQGDLGTPPMSSFGVRSPGHEGAGIVVKVGANVKNFKLGDRAGIKPLLNTCGACELCWGDKETYCRTAIHTGLMAPGTYQQYIVSPARYASPIPDGIPDEVAAPIMCSASTIYRSLTESGLKPGNWAVFPGGGGGVGIQGVQLAKAMGMRPIVVDTGDSKKALALAMGAEVFVDFLETPEPAAAVIKAADGVGAHGIFVTAPAAYRTAISYVGNRIGAVVMCIGLGPAGAMTIGEDPNAFIFKNLTVKGTLVGSRQDTAAALDFARQGKLQQICEVYPIDQLPEAVEKLRKGQATGRMAVDFNK
ncbi:glycosyl hydrolase family 76-domain-containing protein [Aspergillus bertholletiae]|uniref:mannan endo-1,6-alpha-mannosidase n=1 Tax=Aspergillus bertholletiae TaxID=1226010 RepID=A0A5N7BPR5_9EURO|nr:glycosyl hydrolase family 76-domain-containing protein [Aspergillus bertholletiae]